jgi:hypothetical protein
MADDDFKNIIITDPLTGKDMVITHEKMLEMLTKGIYIDAKSIKKEEK